MIFVKDNANSGRASRHHLHRHRLRWWPLRPSDNQASTIEQRTQGGHIHGHPVPGSERCTRSLATLSPGYDRGRCTGRQPGNHYRTAHPRRPHPRPPSPRIRTAHPVTGYDGGHWHRAATSQPLSSSAPQAATPTATQSPDQSGAPSLHSHRHLATMVATDTRRQPGNHYWAAHPRRPHSRPPIHGLEPRPPSPIRWWTLAHGGRVAITEQQK